MKMYTIYRHINKINGKSYIGQTCQKLSRRWKSGYGYTKERQPTFYNAIQKYGWDNFEHEILSDNIKTLDEANEQEKYWIAYYHTWVYDSECNGYNITKGGDGTPGHIMSEQTKAKIKKAVYCVELDQIFDSITIAAEATGCRIGKICLCCKGQANTAGGYHWRYVDEKLSQKAEQIANDRLNKKQDYYTSLSTAVYCEVDGKKFTFSSRGEAAKWWFNTYCPFGPVFYKGTYMKKIDQSIKGEPIFTGKNQYDRKEITNIKWFLDGGNDNG
jgi:group I intron endonuclease